MFTETAEKKDAFLKFVDQFGKCLKYPRGDHNTLAVRQEKYFGQYHIVTTSVGFVWIMPQGVLRTNETGPEQHLLHHR